MADANTTTWPDWYAEIEAAFERAGGRCEHVFAFGLSMGGTLVTRLAEQKRDRLAGLVLVNPSYGTDRLTPSSSRYDRGSCEVAAGIGSDIKRAGAVSEGGYDRTPVVAFDSLRKLWKVVTADFAKITAPILMYRSVEDHVVEPLSAQLLQTGAVNTTIREVLLLDSYHVATMDNDAQTDLHRQRRVHRVDRRRGARGATAMTLDHPGDRNRDDEPPPDVDAAFAELIADWHVDTTQAIKDAERALTREDSNWRARLQPEPAEFAEADDPTYWPEDHYEPPPPPPLPRLHGRTVLAICILVASITLIVVGSALGLPFAFSLALGVAGVLTSTGLLITRLRTSPNEDDDGAIV